MIHAQITTHFATLHLGEGCVYALALGGGRASHAVYTRSALRLLGFAQREVCAGRDVYYGALPRARMVATADGVVARDALFADVDVGKPGAHPSIEHAIAAVHSFAVPATTIIASGSGVHVRYQLERDVPHATWEVLQAAVNRALGGDRAAMDVARVHRVPGTLNYKRSPPRPVTLIEANAATTVESVRAALEQAGYPPQAVAEARPIAAPSAGPRRHAGRPFDLANDVPVREVLAFLGVDTFFDEGSRTYCGCPVCPGPDDHELVVGGRCNVATCFGDCRRTFTAVDLVVAVRGVTPREAVDQLAEHFGFVGFPRRSSGGGQ